MSISSEIESIGHSLWKPICKEVMMISIEVIQGKIDKGKGFYRQEQIIWGLKQGKVISLYFLKITIQGFSIKVGLKAKVIKRFFWEIISSQVQLVIKIFLLNQILVLVNKSTTISLNQILMDLVQNCKDCVNKSRNKSIQ